MKNMKISRSLRLSLLFTVSIIIFMALQQCSPAFASAATTATYNQNVQDFISDSKWCDGADWGESKRPESSSYDSYACCAYCADFCKEVYGVDSWNGADFTEYGDVNDIQSGDIIHLNNILSIWGHWFVVLGRQGDKLWTAEGNYGNGIVKIANYETPEYVISNGKLTKADGTNLAYDGSFDCGYHCNDVTYITPVSFTISNKYLQVGENVTFNFSPTDANRYDIAIYKDGATPTPIDCGTNTSYTCSFSEPGNYFAYVTATNEDGSFVSDTRSFTVLQPDTDYKYSVKDGKATITKYIGNETDIETKTELGGFPVTAIGDKAFEGCLSLNSVNIQPGVVNIGWGAFYDCNNLKAVTIPNTVITIGVNAFQNANLSSITIPDGVQTIGQDAFSNCSGLTSVTIPKTVTSIGPGVFYLCSNLTSINVDADNLDYLSIDGVLYDKPVTTLIECPAGLTSVNIHPDVTSIEIAAFAGCRLLTAVDLPEKLTQIGAGAFDSCKTLTSIDIPPGITDIPIAAFYNCGFNKVNLPSGLTSIGQSAFEGNTDLTSIDVPNSVTSIGPRAFFCCNSLKSITFNSKTTAITDDGMEATIPTQTTIIGYGDSTAHGYATRSSPPRKFIEITPGLLPVTLTPNSPNIDLFDTPLQVIALSDVNNGTITTRVETMPQVRVVSSTSLGSTVDVSIQDGTEITSVSNWDGIINLPQAVSSQKLETIKNHPIVASIGVAFEIGQGDTDLTFSQPVRILISDQGGLKAGWVRDDYFEPIDLMLSDSAADLGANDDGYLTVGNDLVIWTSHFTAFVAYTETALTGYTLSGQVLVEGDDLTEGQLYYSGGATIEIKQGEEIKYSTISSEAEDLIANGCFSITGITAGNYTVVISKTGYLTRSFALTINSDLTLSTTSDLYHNRIYLWAGDIVSDEYRVIAAADVNYILSQFNSNSTQAGFDPQVDIVKDQYNVIAAADVNLMLSNFNKNSTQYPADIVY